MDVKMLGERFRQVRKRLGLTQLQLAEATHLTQSVISRLENGEEIYASAMMSILYYYQGKVCLDYLFSPDFNIESGRLIVSNQEDGLLLIRKQLDVIADIVSSANETTLSHLEKLKKTCL